MDSEDINVKLRWGVDAARVAASRVASKVTVGLLEAERQLRELEGIYRTIYYGQLCERALVNGVEPTLMSAQSLFAAWKPEYGNSPYAVAAHNERFQALSDFIHVFWCVSQPASAAGTR